MYILKQTTANNNNNNNARVIANHRRNRCTTNRHDLLHLPLDLLLKISKYLTFADLWYLSTCSRYCRTLSHQIIWHRYHIDLSKPQLHAYNHIVYGALAYINRHGYQQNEKVDFTVIQSVSNRLAVEIYDRSPLKNWEHCLDYFLDKTLGIVIDHIMLDPLLDNVPDHNNTTYHHHHCTEFNPTRIGQLMSCFLTTFYPTLLALFETEPTTEIHHRLLINHINRHIDTITNQYHHQHYQRCTTPNRHHYKALQQHTLLLRLQFRILIRFIGTLLQTELLNANDLSIITRQRIQSFFLIDEPPFKKKRRNSQKIALYESLKNHHSPQWLEEVEFQIEIFSDLTRAALLIDSSSEVVTVLNNTVNTLINM